MSSERVVVEHCAPFAVDVNADDDEPAARLATIGFEAFYESRYEQMVRLATLVLGDAHTAEEVVQDGFAAIYLKWARIDHPDAYVRQVILNRCRDVIRRRKISNAVRRRGHDVDIVEHREPIDDLLDALSPRERAVVVLRFYDDQTVDEIARVLGLKAGTVKSLLHRALARLREGIER